MRIEMDGREFKNYLERAMAIVKPGAVLPYMESIEIVASDDNTALYAENQNGEVVIHMNAQVDESGKAFIHANNIKRVCNMTGHIIIEAKGNTFVVRNGKKKIEIPTLTFDYEVKHFYSGIEQCKELFKMPIDKFVDALAATDAARDQCKTPSREILSGININGNRMILISCDGFRMHAAKIDTVSTCSKDFVEFNRTIHGEVYANLKRIIKGVSGTSITAYDCGKCLKISGCDFDYYIQYIEGDYPPIYDSLYRKEYNNKKYSYDVDADELCGIAKVYAKQRSGNKHFMYMMNTQHGITTAYLTDDYRSADTLNTVDDMSCVNDSYTMAFNPKYISDAMSAVCLFGNTTAHLFGDYREVGGANIKPICIHHNMVEMLVLPARVDENQVRGMRDFVCVM